MCSNNWRPCLGVHIIRRNTVFEVNFWKIVAVCKIYVFICAAADHEKGVDDLTDSLLTFFFT